MKERIINIGPRLKLNCTPCQGHDGYNYLPNFYPANKGFIPVFVY